MHTNLYLHINKAIKRLIFAQGADAEILLRVLDKFEVLGPNKYINEQLQAAIAKNPKVAEFDTVIKAALFNWTTGTAHSITQHGVNNGFDAWRKLYNRYVFLAQDLQNIFICEFMFIKPVSENDIDSVFNAIEFIIDLHVKAGPSGDLSEKWIRAVILKNLPEKISTALAIDLKKAATTEEM